MILIPLSQERFSLIDDADADLIAFKWYAEKGKKTFYAARHDRDNGRHVIKLHRVIAKRMGISGYPDHVSRHGLDNRRRNLRAATIEQQIANQGIKTSNTSGFKGVNVQGGKWRARIMVDKHCHSLGLFTDKIEAARAYDIAARELLGEFAVLNFPDNT